jgi:glycosyltransferase involved in cell wall biosynthesis
MSKFIKIFSPSQNFEDTGNSVTAKRYFEILRGLGHEVSLATNHEISSVNRHISVAFVLHATKCSNIIQRLKELEVPIVLILTGTDLYNDLSDLTIRAGKTCLYSLQAASAIIVLHENAINDLLKIARVPRKKIFVIYQSTENILKKKKEKKQKINHRILMVSHIRPEKDIETAIRGFNEFIIPLKGTSTSWEIDHYGGSTDIQYEKKAKEMLSINKGFNFCGIRTKEEINKLYMKYDLFLHPSAVEGGSLVVREALEAGLPIIASNISCHKSLLGENYNGLYKQGSAKDLALKLKNFFFDEGFKKNMELLTRKSNGKLATREKEALGLKNIFCFLET